MRKSTFLLSSIKGSAGGETLFLERVAAVPGELFPEHELSDDSTGLIPGGR